MAKLVTIFGGSGFLGRYIAQRMAREGWRVRVAVRRPNEAMHVKLYGAVGQVEPVLCNVRDDASVLSAIRGADAVVNCVGILVEQGRNRFDALHRDAAARIARTAHAEQLGRLVHISAIGADPEAASRYSQTKGLGEKEVLAHFANAVILRPSVIFGTEDQFFNRFARMMRWGPVLPIVGGATRMQPVYVDDVAAAAVAGVLGKARPGIYELGGPETRTLAELVSQMLDITRRRRLVLNMPFWIGSIMAAILDAAQSITVGLFSNSILTRDQVKALRVDSVVGAENDFETLGIAPVAMETVLPEYLWVYRPSGQFASIVSSAKNLKT